MQRLIMTAALTLALAGPAAAQMPNVQQLLQGLTTGNQNQDQGLRDAFERGYQRGRQDEAQMSQSRRNQNDRGNNQRGDRYDPNQDRGRQREYDQPNDRR